MVANDLKVQRTLHDPSRGRRVLSSETIGHFLKKINKYIFIYFLTILGMFFSKTLFLCDVMVSKLSGNFYSGSELILLFCFYYSKLQVHCSSNQQF